MQRWLMMAFVPLLLLLLMGCGSSTDTAPVERVKGFVAAAEAKDVNQMVQFLLPEERRDAAMQLRQVMPSVQTVQYKNPTYELKDNDGSTAYVRVTGQIYAETASGEQVEQPIDQLLTLVKQDGEWYIKASEVQLPQISP